MEELNNVKDSNMNEHEMEKIIGALNTLLIDQQSATAHNTTSQYVSSDFLHLSSNSEDVSFENVPEASRPLEPIISDNISVHIPVNTAESLSTSTLESHHTALSSDVPILLTPNKGGCTTSSISEKLLCDNNIEKVSAVTENGPESIQKKSKTALIYDPRMTSFHNLWENHPERPERVSSIYHKLVEDGLAARCTRIASRLISEEEVLAHHTVDHLNMLKSLEDKSNEELEHLSDSGDSIYFHKNTYECARLSAGCTLEVVDYVLSGKAVNGAAVVRPPGHHALSHCSMGFCHFNNVALAATMAKKKYGLKRVLIVDWDVHYGNGIKEMFDDDPSVLYFSIHRYDHGTFWPTITCGGNYDEVGVGNGEGYNMHVAWNEKKMGDAEYLAVFTTLLMPVAYEFSPELVLISAGFDAGLGDPLGGCKVSPEGYAHMTHMLSGLADGKVCLILEGGYNLQTISNSFSNCVSALLGDPCPSLKSLVPTDSALDSIWNTCRSHSKYWRCLRRYGAPLNDMNASSNTPFSTPLSHTPALTRSQTRSQTRAPKPQTGSSTLQTPTEFNEPKKRKPGRPPRSEQPRQVKKGNAQKKSPPQAKSLPTTPESSTSKPVINNPNTSLPINHHIPAIPESSLTPKNEYTSSSTESILRTPDCSSAQISSVQDISLAASTQSFLSTPESSSPTPTPTTPNTSIIVDSACSQNTSTPATHSIPSTHTITEITSKVATDLERLDKEDTIAWLDRVQPSWRDHADDYLNH